jgi:hypothetical protein
MISIWVLFLFRGRIERPHGANTELSADFLNTGFEKFGYYCTGGDLESKRVESHADSVRQIRRAEHVVSNATRVLRDHDCVGKAKERIRGRLPNTKHSAKQRRRLSDNSGCCVMRSVLGGCSR